MRLIEFLGIKAEDTTLEFPFSESENQSALNLLRSHNLEKGKYAVIHAGARDTKRWWAPQNFAKVIEHLIGRGLSIVLTGTEQERENVMQVEKLVNAPLVNLVGQTDLPTFAAVIKNARILLSNDTGASHIAAATQTPSIVVFLSSDPQRWAPLDTHRHQIIPASKASDLRFVQAKTQELLQTFQ